MIAAKDLKIRFENDPLSYRWGNIASDLLRIASIASSASYDAKSFENVLTEVKLFTEWLSPNLDLQDQKTVILLQRKLSEWSFKAVSKNSVAIDAKKWSRKILALSKWV